MIGIEGFLLLSALLIALGFAAGPLVARFAGPLHR